MKIVLFHENGKYLRAYLPTETVEEEYNGLEFFVYDSLPSEIENLKADEDAFIAVDGSITIKPKPPKPLTPVDRITQVEEDNATLLMQLAEQQSHIDQQAEDNASLLMVLAEKGILV